MPAGDDAARPPGWRPALAAGTALAAGEDDPDDPTAFVVATSGLDRHAQGRAAAVLGAARPSRPMADPDRPDRSDDEPGAGRHWLLTLPAQHIAGLQVLLRSLAEGTSPTVLDTAPAVHRRPGSPRRSSRLPAGRRFVSLVPTQLHRILADPEATAALATFDAVLVGGAATPPALLGRRPAGEDPRW